MNHKKKASKMRIAFIIHCLFIPLVSFGVFYLFVNYRSILMAFQNREGQWTMENFVRLYNEVTEGGTYLNTAIRNTLITFAITLVTFPVKVCVAYFIYKKVPFYGFYRIMFFLPGIIFSVAQSMIVIRMLAPTGAIAEWVAQIMNLSSAPDLLADSRYANAVVLLHMIWISFPGDLIVWGGTFARIPDDVLESARIDGVSWWKELTRIIVPMVWPTVSISMIMTVCGLFGATGEAFLFTGGEYGTETLSSWMYKILINNSGVIDSTNVFNYLSAAGLIMTVIAVGLSLIIRKFIDRAFEEVEY